MILVFLGPPGSGKGTQAKLLADKYNLPHISLGDLLRAEVHSKSEMGLKIGELINAGKLAPDELTIAITKKRVAQADCQSGFILDGFPRSGEQAEALDQMLSELGRALDKVVYFQVDENKIVDRLSGRRSCQTCGAVYHVKYNLPKDEGKCDVDGTALYQRKDDVEDAIRTRFAVYAKSTMPLIDRYKKSEKLVTISADGAIDEVFGRLLNIVADGQE
ncbi:MAG: adenylate kinase [bacterium]